MAFLSDPIVESTIFIFTQSIDNYNISCVSATDKCRLKDLFDAIIRYNALDKQCHSIVSQSICLKYYLFFYDSLIERPLKERRFLDGVFGVELFTGSYGAGPKCIARFNNLSATDVVKDRLKSARKLSTLEHSDVQKRCGHYIAEDLPLGVGMRVAALVGRCRLITQCASQLGSKTKNIMCQSCNCKRMMLDMDGASVRPTMHELFGTETEHTGHLDDYDNTDYTDNADSWTYPSTSYWRRIVPGTVANLPRFRFCSLSCVHHYQHELSLIVPFNVYSFESHELQSSIRGKVGLPRVVAVARAAMKRNASAVRTLRQSKHTIRKLPATTLDGKVIDSIHRNVKDILNIDLGLLQAAASIAESPLIANGRVLPGTIPDWRMDHLKWGRAIEMIKSIYASSKGATSASEAVDERDVPSWLRKVRDYSLRIFPIALENGTSD